LQIDDIFNRNHLWDVVRQIEESGPPYRPEQGDVVALLHWLDQVQQQPNSRQLMLDLAFNGAGVLPEPVHDTLFQEFMIHQARFRWLNHGYTHLLLDHAAEAESLVEVQRNHTAALGWRLGHYEADCMVTANVSGLENPAFLRAAYTAGIRYLVSDRSKSGWGNPAPNVGIVSSLQPEVLLIPRHANNLFYDVSTPEEWVSKYNHLYRTYWGYESSFAEILQREAEAIVRYLLTWDMDPIMFHQPNLRAYDGKQSLLANLLDRVLARYRELMGEAPICCPNMHELGLTMTQRAAYNAAQIQANLIRGSGLVLLADRDVVAPLTGVKSGAASEVYADQHISCLALGANTMYWVPLADLTNDN
jgi:hypothetical protein